MSEQQEMDVNSFLLVLSTHLGTNYTDEQKEFAKNFDKTMICFASPGTGKTMSSIAGLLTAELYYRIPGNKIYALSFTRMATGEIAARHTKACAKLRIRQTVNFKTLHSICAELLRDNAKYLGMNSLKIVDNLAIQTQVDLISESCKEWNIAIDEKNIPRIVRAVRSLNSSLTFDRKNVEDSSVFKNCNVDYDLFNKIRGLMFSYCLVTEQVQVGDIMLYTLLLLTHHPEVSQKFQSNCEVMLVDEAQDLSLLQLKIISLLAKHVILIGDMKQQIYAFNGACQEIVEQFYKLYPTAFTLELTQSFRCKDSIAEFANSIIQRNATGNENMAFSGVGPGGDVTITDSLNLELIVDEVSETYFKNRNNFTKDILFLFRNNASAVPIAEHLYRKHIPFRVNNYIKAFDLPVICDLTNLALLASSPTVPKNVDVLRLVIHEFSTYRNVEASPLYKIMTKTGMSVFDINYQYKNQQEATEVFEVLMEARKLINEGAYLTDVFNVLWNMYDSHYLKNHAYLLEYPVKYYLGLVNTLIRTKTLDMFIQEELEKEKTINTCINANTGIRCYTMHASKGLEADIVYILDADDGIIPNNKKIQKMIQQDCAVEAAREIHNERSLCYVAATRAKESLTIQYNNVLTPIYIPTSTDHDELDEIYRFNKHTETDIESFEDFVKEFIGEEVQ